MQTRHRVEQLQQLGHSVDKVEFIVMGGTFMCLSEEYRDYFIRNLHDALSGHSSSSVAEAVKYSEKSRTKCIGITIETRPDYCLKRHISDMLSYGCTRLEVGVQSVYEDVARDTNRGHTVRAVSESFEQSKVRVTLYRFIVLCVQKISIFFNFFTHITFYIKQCHNALTLSFFKGCWI